MAPLRIRRTMGTVAIQEHSVLDVTFCAAIVRPGCSLARLGELLLGERAAVL